MAVLSEVLLDQLGDVGLVRQDVAGDARREEQADERRYAAAQFEDERRGVEHAVREERVLGLAEPFCEERGGFPDDLAWAWVSAEVI